MKDSQADRQADRQAARKGRRKAVWQTLSAEIEHISFDLMAFILSSK